MNQNVNLTKQARFIRLYSRQLIYAYCRSINRAQSTYNQNMITVIKHQCAIQIKFLKHYWRFCQLLKKLAIVERLFLQLYGLSTRTKK